MIKRGSVSWMRSYLLRTSTVESHYQSEVQISTFSHNAMISLH
jgi:hypothetical protein